MAVIQSGRVTLLRGDDMMADPDYKRRHREFQQVINPKPSKEVLEAQLAAIQAERQAWFDKRAAERAELAQAKAEPAKQEVLH